MLRVGLTGGIGAGKSTVARLLTERGAVLVDADVLAREVVEAGTPGLAAVVERFGAGVLTSQGALDRPALGRLVFGDPAARAALNGIVHPLVAARRRELTAAAPADAVVVEDVPLLVETGAAPSYPLVVVVDADAGERVRRLVTERGMDPADARARLAAQAGDDERRAVADVVLPNPRRAGDAPDPLPGLVERLWIERLLPFEAGLRTGRVPAAPAGAPAGSDAARVRARVEHAAGVPTELSGPDRWPLRLRVVTDSEVGGPLGAVGFVPAGQDAFASADPGCAVRVEVARAARVGGRA